MQRVLILFAHPALRKSRVHRALLAAVRGMAGVTLHDLYEAYPEFDVEVQREQGLLVEHDIVIMQHPFYWYSTPPLLKQWQDLVLQHGWAYGSTGRALAGRTLLNVISAGGPDSSYGATGLHRRSIRDLLAPIEQTARLCRMRFLPPWVIFGSHRLEPADIDEAAQRYARLLEALARGDLDSLDGDHHDTLNAALACQPAAGEA